ncbi:MAG: hypothetical protein ACTSYD_02515 [Candidatus Heimdallarchaeaceae archaeon]
MNKQYFLNKNSRKTRSTKGIPFIIKTSRSVMSMPIEHPFLGGGVGQGELVGDDKK